MSDIQIPGRKKGSLATTQVTHRPSLILNRLKGVNRAIILEKLIKHGRVDKRAIRLINQYRADPRVAYSREECDHLCRVLDNLMNADDADADIITGAMDVLRYCIHKASKEVKDGIIHKMVFHDL